MRVKGAAMTITYDQFNKIILSLRELDSFREKLYEVGMDSEVYHDLICNALNAFEEAIFNPTQSSVANWWLYEAGGLKADLNPTKPMQWDEEGNEMPIHSVKELYDYLMTLEGFESEPVQTTTTIPLSEIL